MGCLTGLLKMLSCSRSCQVVADKTARELLEKKMSSGEGGPKDVMTLLGASAEVGCSLLKLTGTAQ